MSSKPLAELEIEERRRLITNHYQTAVSGAQMALAVSELVTFYGEWLAVISALAAGKGDLSDDEDSLLKSVRDGAETAGNLAVRALADLQALDLAIDLDELELGNFDPRPLFDVVERWAEVCRAIVMIASRRQAERAVLAGLDDIEEARRQAAELLGDAQAAVLAQQAALDPDNPLRDIPLLHHSCAFCSTSALMIDDPEIWDAFSAAWSAYHASGDGKASVRQKRAHLAAILFVPNGAMPQISSWPRPLGLVAARCLLMHLISKQGEAQAADWIEVVDKFWGDLPEHIRLIAAIQG
jgi:hypothetical protein